VSNPRARTARLHRLREGEVATTPGARTAALDFFRMNKINLAEKFSRFSAHWSPKIVAELNGQHVKLVKFQGEFVWHQHEQEDELFYVVRGSFRMEFRDRTVALTEGEMIVVPRGVEHRPVADNEVSVLLFEPAATLNTGNAGGERTVAQPEWI
jgi:mannose-6-phosphate isomerase-like protein (cupin superfamily)